MARMTTEPALETVTLLRRGGELRIELARPDSLNAWNHQLGRDLLAALEVAREDDVRSVTITGAGRAFSSGGDLRAGFEPTEAGHPDVGTPMRELYHPAIAAVRRLPKPVLAAVNGPAVGIGCSLALACDLVLARESAYLLLAFVNIGLAPDGGASAMVSARAGFTRAAEMAMLGERIPAAKAVEWGLINRAVPDDEFDAEVDALAARLASGPTRAYAGIKRQLNSWLFERMEDQLDVETEVQEELAASGDFAEGVTAFIEKRAVQFTGS
jgi:2-(1,2-epoxy-1,2-dihydrophenyl)acetyl-CoA isomerase